MEETMQTENIQEPKTEEQPAAAPAEQPKTDRTFTRAEVNKMVAAEKQKAVEAAKAELERRQEEAKQRQTEAEKFSKMQAEDQVKTLQERLAELEREKSEIQLQREADKLKQAAIEKASEVKLPLSFVSDLDYRTIKAEELDGLINGRLDAFNAEIERRLNEILPNRVPETHKQTADPDAWRKAPSRNDNRKPWEKYTNR